MKKVLILGATTSKDRYAYLAAQKLVSHGYQIVPVGIREGVIFDTLIINTAEIQTHIDTITLYLSPANQKQWYDYILETKPRRIIFNPGTENQELKLMAETEGIATEEACTLVLLGTNQF